MKIYVAIADDGDWEASIMYIHSSLSKLENLIRKECGEEYSCNIYETNFDSNKGLYLKDNGKLNNSYKFIKEFNI